MSEPSQTGAVVTLGDLVFDFGSANQEQAWRFCQLLRNGNVEVTVNGKPA